MKKFNKRYSRWLFEDCVNYAYSRYERGLLHFDRRTRGRQIYFAYKMIRKKYTGGYQ